MDYTQDFINWRSRKMGRVAHEMYTTDGIPLEKFKELFKSFDEEFHMKQLKEDWDEYVQEMNKLYNIK